MKSRLQEKFNKEVLPKLKEELKLKNVLQAPRLEKVVVNVGFGTKAKEGKFIEAVEDTLKRITGQKPAPTAARMSISNFKLRAGMTVGMKVTLRGPRMYEFTDKLINATLPRVRDFRGIRITTVDNNGNLNIGFKEHLAFPEIRSDEVEQIHGLEVTIVSTAKNRDDGFKLFQMLGFPFNDKLKKEKRKKVKKYGK